MDDFASVAMMRVVQGGLRRQGLVPAALPPARQGRVALPDKRAQLQALWDTRGPAVIARLGEAVHDLADDPLLTAFSAARDPFDLLERWQRLERFVHSRHRIVVQPTGPQSLQVQHVSLRAAAPPTPAEDLLVLGLLLALARRLGVRGLRARPADSRAWLFDDGWRGDTFPAQLDRWDWQWQDNASGVSAVRASEALALLQADPARGWTLAHLARALHVSPRSLQRRLAREGERFSALLVQARLNHAAHLLTHGTASLAEIGYLSGHADQAHFTRCFHAHTGLTPAMYRAQFAAPPALSRSATPR